MSDLTFINEKGAGQIHSDKCHYSQAVKLPGGIVKCSGQGGWDNTGFCDGSNLDGQVKNAFMNVDRVLQAAGLRGWEDVYSIRSYHCDIAASFPMMVKLLQERIPGHRPVWTSIGVTRLAFDTMLIEVEVEAIKHQA